MLFDLFFDIRGQEFCLEGEPFNFIEPNFKSTINILVENFIPQNPGGQGQRMAHGDDFIILHPAYMPGTSQGGGTHILWDPSLCEVPGI